MVQSELLEKIGDDRLTVHVVWTPVLQNDNRDAATVSQDLIPDPRATHYWDGDMVLGAAYGESVALPSGRDFAWDIYFAYDHGVQWGEAVPMPVDFAHQLGRDDRHLGDGSRLRAIIQELIDGLE